MYDGVLLHTLYEMNSYGFVQEPTRTFLPLHIIQLSNKNTTEVSSDFIRRLMPSNHLGRCSSGGRDPCRASTHSSSMGIQIWAW